MMKQFVFYFTAVAGVTLSCTNNDDDASVTCGSQTISYSTTVAPIITSSCATTTSCHGTGSSRGPGALTSYSAVFANRSSIKTAVANGSMPENGKLTSDQKNSIICWIENGATNN